jgi:hypothetical protein
VRVHLRFLLLLLGLDLLLFHALVLNPTHILYSDHSDLIAEHIPAKRFLVRSFQQTGELPLWCPHMFAGSPFVHDIQVAMFYPPHLLLLALPEEAVGPVVSWFVVLHVLLAGWLMYAYACHRGLPPLPAFIAGVGFMFGGRWLMHLLGGGHYILIGLAWLPLVLIGWERAIQRRGPLWGLLAGVAFALLTLSTQPQWTFYAGIFMALWTFGLVLEEREQRWAAFFRWAGYGLSILAVTVGLAAIQLLPTLEAAGQSSRAGGVGTEDILAGGVRVLLFLFGWPQSSEPFNLAWEDRGGLGPFWVTMAIWAVLLRLAKVRYEAGVCLFLMLFAMGGAILFQPLPGFNLFRQPARMMVLVSFPIAWLAAVGTEVLFKPDRLSELEKARCWRWFLRVFAAMVLLRAGYVVRLWLQGKEVGPDYYLIGLFSVCVVLWSVVKDPFSMLRAERRWAWVGLLIADVCFVVLTLPRTEEQDRVYTIPPSVQFVADRKEDLGRVLDRDLVEDGRVTAAPLGSGAPLALLTGIDAVRGYSPLDVRRYREFLAMIANEDQPLRALESKFTYPVIRDFDIVNKQLADLLGILYEIEPFGSLPSYQTLSPNKRRKVVAKDNSAAVYDFLGGGQQSLKPAYVVENSQSLPRAFVVPEARALPAREDLLQTLKETNFLEVVYLEDWEDEHDTPARKRKLHEVTKLSYQPNRIRFEVDGQTPGFLVLTDVWFPGWKCRVSGEEVNVYRANYAFRTVKVPAGKHVVEFCFEPLSYQRGRIITFATLAIVLVLSAGLLLVRWRHSS